MITCQDIKIAMKADKVNMDTFHCKKKRSDFWAVGKHHYYLSFFLFFSLLSSSDYSNLYQLMHGQVVRIFAHLCLKLVFVYVDHHDKCKASFNVIILQYLQRMILLDQSPLSHIISNYYMYLPLKKEHITTQ